ncbi:16S rRNA (guanine(527)-N(7))-methyltransferase RsmG [Blattabacterium cuenoti]|uniref:16S rRNA (guanine(527)-N(7))-methyltransferase RsmG n=1 Tax=Blattabacterium cuenoti TaxID=1653831 RepID=UPI00163CDF6A|nr:16S rRNA (guanine(527)-N(7))-methyltransferase RsmG [Blattabacterium cuenoti]
MILIKKYFPNLRKKQYNQLYELKHLYKYWNNFINVISRKTFDNNTFYQNHVLFCLSVAKILSFFPGSKVMDLGTGGGFPGIPLSIIFPYVEFLLVDSIKKKIKVVKSIASSINLHNVHPICIRVENLDIKFNFMVTRGVSKINVIHNWIKKSNSEIKNGSLYLKGGDVSQEINKFPHAIEYPLNIYFKENFFITKKIIWIPNI